MLMEGAGITGGDRVSSRPAAGALDGLLRSSEENPPNPARPGPAGTPSPLTYPSKNVSGWTDGQKTAVRPSEGGFGWTDGSKSAIRPSEGGFGWTDEQKTAVRPPEGGFGWTDGQKSAVRPPEGGSGWTDGHKKRRPGGRLSSWGSSLPYASRAALSSSIILMTHIGMRVPGPKMAAAPALYRAS